MVMAAAGWWRQPQEGDDLSLKETLESNVNYLMPWARRAKTDWGRRPNTCYARYIKLVSAEMKKILPILPMSNTTNISITSLSYEGIGL